MAKAKTEAEVTAIKNKGSGAVTDPAQAANPPTEAQQPASEADANPDKDGLRAADRLYANDRLEADYDFEVAQDVDPREGRQPEDANQQDIAEDEEGAIDRMLRIKYRGKEEDVSEEDAITMVQQFKTIDNKYGPIMELSRQLSEATGETDPEKLAGLMAQALHQGGPPNGEPPAVPPQVAAPPAEVARTPMNDPAAQHAMQEQHIRNMEESRAQAQSFFDENGLTPTNEALPSMRNMIMYGGQISQVANVLPSLMADVQQFKEQQAANVQASNQAVVDSTAAATAQELGIDTEVEFNDYLSWVDSQEEYLPGYKQAISSNPKAMDKSIRDYHAIATGNRSSKEQAALKQQVEKNIQRAGGETVASRGSEVPGGPSPTNFNDEIMDLI